MPVVIIKLPMLWNHTVVILSAVLSYSPVPEVLLLPEKCGRSRVAPMLVSMQLPLATAVECDTPSAAPDRTCALDPHQLYCPSQKTQLLQIVSLLCI